MKIILFRFEKDKIHFIECNINSGNFILGKKENINLGSTKNKGEVYKKILDELLHIQTRYSPNILMYKAPEKYMGGIKDEEGFANSIILHLFCYQNNLNIYELTKANVRKKLGSIPNKEFKDVLENNKNTIISEYKIVKSDKLIEGLTLLYSIANTL